jgi:outer membrane cobalamin receptor
MRALKAVKIVALLFAAAFLSTPTFAGSHKDKSAKKNGKEQAKYVFVTGSNIPRKVKVKPVGNTVANLRVYNRQEIDRTGRVTTAGVLAQDPSVSVTMGGAGGIR